MEQESHIVKRESDTIAGIEPTQQSTSVSVVDTLEGFLALKADWDRLVEESAYATIFQTFEWHSAWWTAFGGSHQMRLLVVRDHTAVVGICPLMASGSHGAARKPVLQFIGTPNIDYADSIGPDKETTWLTVLHYMSEHSHDWHKIDLEQVSERSPSFKILSDLLARSGLPHRSRVCETCLAYEFKGSSEERLKFTADRGKNIRRAIKFFEKEGNLHFDRVPADNADQALLEIFQLHINRWNQSLTPSKFLKEENRIFYLELARQLGPLGHLAVTRLATNQLPICSSFNFLFRDSVYHYTIAYNRYFTKWSPGNLYLVFQSEALIRDGLYLDYSRGVQEYKKLLTNQSFYNYQFVIYANRMTQKSAQMVESFKNSRAVRAIVAHRTVVRWRLRISSFVASEGIVHFAWKAALRLLRFVIDTRTVIVFRLEGEPDRTIVPKIPIEMRKLVESEIPLICSFYGVEANSRKHQTILDRFKSGADCFGAFYRDFPVCIGWGIFGQDIDTSTGLVLKAAPNEVISSDGLTAVPYRGMRIRPYLIIQEIDMYRRRGYEMITAVDQSNTQSLRNIRRIGFKEVRKMRLVMLFGIRVL
jgi:CelD/BcsL family acetyltransferase involved in cellulose biosynthesis